MRRLLGTMLAVIILPSSVFASVCTSSGYTIVYTNGILSKSEVDSSAQRKEIEDEYIIFGLQDNVKFITGYNPSHIAGVGDLVQSVTQAFNNPVSDYDLKTILMQIEPQVNTRKILLVGHSQGTFYTNELYKYLIQNGVPEESIGVYNLATPASYVAAGGEYLTSSNDKVINTVRDLQKVGNAALNFQAVAPALPPNITIPPEAEYAQNSWGGHSLSVYLDGEAQTIVAEIDAALSLLKASASVSGGEGCFAPPRADLGYHTRGLLYAIADPLAKGAVTVATSVRGGAIAFTDYVAEGLRNIGHFAGALFSVPPTVASNSQGAAAALATPSITGTAAPAAASEENLQPTQGTSEQSVVDSTPPPATERQAVPQIPATPVPAAPVPQSAFASLVPVQPGFGGGGVQSVAQATVDSTPAPVLLTVATPTENSLYATSSITASGTTVAHALITATLGTHSATTSADASGNWSVELILSEGESAASFVATDSVGDALAMITRTVTLDTIPPDAASILTITECELSIVVSMCVIPATTVVLEWTAVADAATYGIEKNGMVVATTTDLRVNASIEAGATSTFAVIAYDAAGNAARSIAQKVFSASRSLIINEIGWGGVRAWGSSSTDPSLQWIELKNVSPYAIDLSTFSLHRTGGELIELSGSVANTEFGKYFAVLPSSIPGISIPSYITPFSLSAIDVEQISLVWNGAVLDATPAVSTCSTWCAGTAAREIGSSAGAAPLIAPFSMERVSDSVDGLLAESWRDSDGYGGTSYTKAGILSGTPGMENTYGLPESGVWCDEDVRDLVQPNQLLSISTHCVFLSLFVAGDPVPYRQAWLFRGVVGSSTPVAGSTALQDRDTSVRISMPADVQAGEPFFFAISELRNRAGGTNADYGEFWEYFTGSRASAPHGNYVTIPFAYQP